MITQLILVGVIVALIVYDVYAGSLGQPTESAVLRDWARDWTLLAFVAGFLLGHWFGPRVHADVSGWMWALPIFFVLFVLDLGWVTWAKARWAAQGLKDPWWRWSLWYALLGIPAGIWLWPQPGWWSPLN